MKVTIYTTDGETLTIGDMTPDDVAVLTAELHDPDPDGRSEFLTFTLDNQAVSYVQRSQITRIDVDPVVPIRRRVFGA